MFNVLFMGLCITWWRMGRGMAEKRGRKVERREEENRLLCLSEYKDILHRAIAITAISRY